MAGIERFDQFGVFNYLDLLSNGDITKWDEIWEIECNKILMAILLKKEQKIFDKRLRDAYTKNLKKVNK